MILPVPALCYRLTTLMRERADHRALLGELSPQLAFTDQSVRLYQYRDRDQYEVDAVLESASGEVIACEVKAAETVRPEDFRGIQRLARRLGDQLLAGIVLYSGGQPLSFGERLRAWPISALWTLRPTRVPDHRTSRRWTSY